MSVPPPAPYGTTRRTVRVGHSCALAEAGIRQDAAATAAAASSAVVLKR